MNTNSNEFKIAETDIQVYKSLNVIEYRNPDQNWLQRLFGLNKFVSSIEAQVNRFKYVKGIVNPKVTIEPILEREEADGMKMYSVEEGYHSDNELRRDSNAIFVIPKGTRYLDGWYNDDGDRHNRVSETIIFKELIPSKR